MIFQKFLIFHIWVCVTDSPRCLMNMMKINVGKGSNKCGTSLPYFGVKLSCVRLMFANRKKSNDL